MTKREKLRMEDPGISNEGNITQKIMVRELLSGVKGVISLILRDLIDSLPSFLSFNVV